MCQLQNHCVTKRALSAVTGHKEPFNLSMGGHALTDGKLWSTYQLKSLGQDLYINKLMSEFLSDI